MNRKLEFLRESNEGYNPEKIESHPELKVIKSGSRAVSIYNSNSQDEEYWELVPVNSEAEYIKNYKGVFGLIIDGKFYLKAG